MTHQFLLHFDVNSQFSEQRRVGPSERPPSDPFAETRRLCCWPQIILRDMAHRIRKLAAATVIIRKVWTRTVFANVNFDGIVARKRRGMLQGLQVADMQQFSEANALFRQDSSSIVLCVVRGTARGASFASGKRSCTIV